MPHREALKVSTNTNKKDLGGKVAPKSEVVLYVMCPKQIGLFEKGCKPLVSGIIL